MIYSVLMPVYKPNEYFQSAVDSVTSQIDDQGELIIVDDGNQIPLSEHFKNTKWPCSIKIHRLNKNSGIPKALNEGLKICSGDIIIRMDADDISLPSRIEKLLKYLNNNPEIGIVGSDVEVQDFNNEISISTPHLLDDLCLKQCLIVECPLCHASIAIRKSALITIGGYPEEYSHAEDYAMMFKLATNGIKFSNISNVLYRVRKHTRSHTYNNNILLSQFNIFRNENIDAIINDNEYRKIFFPNIFWDAPLETTIPLTLSSAETRILYQNLLYRLGILMMKKGDHQLANSLFEMAQSIKNINKKILFVKMLNKYFPKLTVKYLLNKKLF